MYLKKKRVVENREETEYRPYIQRIEQYTTQKQIQPSIQTKVENSESVEIRPYIQREEQARTEREIVSEVRKETQNIQKKVIQPVIKDVIQPIHLKVKPVIQEAIKPIIIQGQQYHQAINQGVQKLPISYLGTNFEKEVLGETLINKSIYKTSTLPAQYRPVQYKPEMITELGLGLGAAYQTRTVQRSSIGGITEINGGTTIRPSIVRKSVLPTINQGTTVLNTVFGGTKTTVAPPGSVYAGMNQRALTTTTTGQAIYGTTILKPTLIISNLGPTTTSQYGGVVGVGNSVVGSSVVKTGYMPGSQIMGIGGGVGDLAADVTYSTKPDKNVAIPTGYM